MILLTVEILLFILLIFNSLYQYKELFKNDYPPPNPYPSIGIKEGFLGDSGSFAIEDLQLSWGGGSSGSHKIQTQREWVDDPYCALATPASGDPSGEFNCDIPMKKLTKEKIEISANKKEKPYTFILLGKCKQFDSDSKINNLL